MRSIVLLGAALLAGGCSVKSAEISNIFRVDTSDGECAWVQIDKRTVDYYVVPGAIVEVVSDNLTFDNELYLCCPGDKQDPTPVCRESRWLRYKKE